MSPIKILYVLGNALDYGGTSTFVMNYYRELHGNEIHIDFLIYGYTKGIYDYELKEKGSHIFHVPIRSKNPIKHHQEIKKLFNQNSFDIIHSHVDAMNGYVLSIAKKAHIKIRISHAHNTNHLSNHPVKRFLLNHYKRKINQVATHFLTCSLEAGNFMYPKVKKEQIFIINNAFHLKRFTFQKSSRQEVRSMLSIEDDTIVIGHIGRFDYQKNHRFLIPLMSHFKQKEMNVRLICIGQGHLKNEFIKSVNDHQLEHCITVLDPVKNIEAYYSAFDTSILPSLFEGFGYTVIEAQYNGLYTICSKHVPVETNITINNVYLDLNDAMDTWIDAIIQAAKMRQKQSIDETLFHQHDIKAASTELKKLYLKSMYQ